MSEYKESSPYLPGLALPAPAPDGVDAPVWQGAREGSLVLQRCQHCALFQTPPEWICHRCHSFDVEWAEVAGHGKVYSWMRVHNPSHPALTEKVPYLVVVVEVLTANNVKLLGNLLGDPNQPVAIGDAVTAVFEHHEEATLVQWRRLPETQSQ